MIDRMKGFIRSARKEDVGIAYPSKRNHESKYPITEIIGPGGKTVGVYQDSEGKKLPYHIITERVVNVNQR